MQNYDITNAATDARTRSTFTLNISGGSFLFFLFFSLSKYNGVLSISRRDKRSPGEFRFDILHDFDALMYSASLVNVINRSK